VLVNGQRIAGVELAAGGEREFKDYIVEVPDRLRGEKSLTIVFKAVEGSAVTGIYEVRLLKE
jgi:hypothetical protein